MKRKYLYLCTFLFLPLGLSGCTNVFQTESQSNLYQIQLAIYRPLCVDVSNNGTTSGSLLQSKPCATGDLSQQWGLKSMSSDGGSSTGQSATTGSFLFINANSLMCMSVADDPDTAPGQHIVLEPCTMDGSDPTQIWTVATAPAGEAGSQIISSASSQCLDLPYGAAAAEFDMQQYYCTPTDPAQGWVLQSVPAETLSTSTGQ